MRRNRLGRELKSNVHPRHGYNPFGDCTQRKETRHGNNCGECVACACRTMRLPRELRHFFAPCQASRLVVRDKRPPFSKPYPHTGCETCRCPNSAIVDTQRLALPLSRQASRRPFRQRLAEPFLGATDPHLDRLGGGLELLGGLLLCQTSDHREQQRLFIAPWQRGDCLIELTQPLLMAPLGGRIRLDEWRTQWRLLGSKERQEPSAHGATAAVVAAFVERYRAQPAGERLPRIKAPQCKPRRDEGLLHQVVRVVGVADIAAHEAIEGGLMYEHQTLERLSIPSLRGDRQPQLGLVRVLRHG